MQRIVLPTLPRPVPQAPHAVRAGRWVFLSGQLATDYETGPCAAVGPAPDRTLLELPWTRRQASYIFDTVEAVLKESGSGLDRIVRLDQTITSREEMFDYKSVRRERFGGYSPASTSVVVTGLLSPSLTIQTDVMATTYDSGGRVEPVQVTDIPAPIGGYYPAVRFGRHVFVSGQLASDFRTGIAPEARIDPTFWEGSSIDAQANFVFANLAKTLASAGSSMEQVVRAELYLTNICDLPRLEVVWRRWFPENPPARLVVPVKALAVLGADLEVTIVAATGPAGDAGGPSYVRVDHPAFRGQHAAAAAQLDDLLYLSGLAAVEDGELIAGGNPAPGFPYARHPAAEQMRYILEVAQDVCRQAGSDLRRALRARWFLTDLHDTYPCAVEWQKVFGSEGPALSIQQVPGPMPVPGCKVILDLIVHGGPGQRP